MNTPKQHYYTAEVARQYRVTRQSIWNWIKTGRLQAIKVGANYRTSETSLSAFLGDVIKP
jgi:excisionase family DNA binding protein